LMQRRSPSSSWLFDWLLLMVYFGMPSMCITL
jgi:hypothetical protein